jgi:hypothetical protein
MPARRASAGGHGLEGGPLRIHRIQAVEMGIRHVVRTQMVAHHLARGEEEQRMRQLPRRCLSLAVEFGVERVHQRIHQCVRGLVEGRLQRGQGAVGELLARQGDDRGVHQRVRAEARGLLAHLDGEGPRGPGYSVDLGQLVGDGRTVLAERGLERGHPGAWAQPVSPATTSNNGHRRLARPVQ